MWCRPRRIPARRHRAHLWTPASQRFLLDFAEAGGYQDCDAAGVKLYPQHDGDTPENLVALAGLIDRTFHGAGVHPALWNTGSATAPPPTGRWTPRGPSPTPSASI